MAESSEQKTTLKITNDIMKNHMITFLIQYVAAIQNIQDRQQLVLELMNTWEKKFQQSVNIVKKATAQTYAEQNEEDEDVWNIIFDATNMHVDDLVSEFSEKMKEMLLQNLKII